jgi:hypothetical protein
MELTTFVIYAPCFSYEAPNPNNWNKMEWESFNNIFLKLAAHQKATATGHEPTFSTL